MWELAVLALDLDDAGLIIVFAALLVGAALVFLIYLFWKRARDDKAALRFQQAQRRRKKKKAKEVPEPGNEPDAEESYVMTLYDLLGVKRTASSEQIKKAYRSAVKNMHPDKTGMNDRSFVSSLNIAKHTLLDPKERKRYDEFLNRREVTWIHEAAGEVQGPDHRIMVTKGQMPRLAPGEQVCRKSNEFMDWDG